MGARTRGIANNILSDGLDATDGLSGTLPSSNITNASVTNVTSTPSIGGGFEKVASDPPSPTEGDIWYNTTSNTVKGYVLATTPSSWSSGGNLPAPVSANQGAGTQTAALSISGQPNAPGTAATTATNEYDGSAWTAGGSLAAGAASYGGASSTKGSQTASLYWGGYNPTPPPAGYRTTVSSYDGSSWTAQSPFPGFSSTGYISGAGTESAALGMGGYQVTNTYESDASYNWTAGGALPQARYATAAGGPQTAAISAGGFGGSPVVIQNNADTYDGSSWTAISVTPITYAQKNGCFGTDSSDFVLAGGTPNRADTIAWDGTSWSTKTSLSTGRQAGSGAGVSGQSGLIAGGQNPSFTNATEEFTGAITAAQVRTLG